MKVTQAIDLWLTPGALRFRRRVGPTWASVRKSLILHIERVLGQEDLDDLAPEHLELVQRVMTEQLSLKPNTVNRAIHGAFFGFTNDMVANGLMLPVARDRLRLVPRLPLDTSKRVQHFSPEQRDKAISAFFAEGNYGARMVATLFLTGLRGGEAAGLQQQDCDWRKRGFWIERSRSRNLITPCKTQRSRRWVPWTDRLYEILLPLRDDSSPTAWLFKGERTDAISMTSFRNSWNRILRNANLPPLKIHGCRHSWATCAVDAGMPIAEVAAHMGDTIEVVMTTYVHVAPRFDPNRATEPPRPIHSPPPVERPRPHLYVVK